MAKPWGASIPDCETLRRLIFDEGLTNQTIADQIGIAEPTLRYHLKKCGISRPVKSKHPRYNHKKQIPWKLDSRQGHSADSLGRLLQVRSGLAQGDDRIPQDAINRLRDMEAGLKTDGLVIDYTTELGFFTVARDPDIDDPDDIIRRPVKPTR